MKKAILNIGKKLNRAEQKAVNGGGLNQGISDGECRPSGASCTFQGFLGNDCPDLDELCNLQTMRCYCPD
jgi:hypothetical protein